MTFLSSPRREALGSECLHRIGDDKDVIAQSMKPP